VTATLGTIEHKRKNAFHVGLGAALPTASPLFLYHAFFLNIARDLPAYYLIHLAARERCNLSQLPYLRPGLFTI